MNDTSSLTLKEADCIRQGARTVDVEEQTLCTRPPRYLPTYPQPSEMGARTFLNLFPLFWHLFPI